ncbi:hypothetical protein JOC54_002333 [Alkalihalobacillus xiaoxiensis]|uniref:Uncharacterized protein n=1 Tax=Shouchella xiaoxiensis TaxID=766895 RepID=A0ABS2SU39_9BACI|nr:hypothetical protein [Shouchella xiaoxiensis]MBM7839063.1 hypothetical protein [Shouchella xiaoxiensis]
MNKLEEMLAGLIAEFENQLDRKLETAEIELLTSIVRKVEPSTK